MDIQVKDNKCMCCETKVNITIHHAIPQRMQPKNNLLIPLCDKCHKSFHSRDINGLKGQLHAAVNHLKRTFQKIQGVTAEDVTEIKYKGKKKNGNR